MTETGGIAALYRVITFDRSVPALVGLCSPARQPLKNGPKTAKNSPKTDDFAPILHVFRFPVRHPCHHHANPRGLSPQPRVRGILGSPGLTDFQLPKTPKNDRFRPDSAHFSLPCPGAPGEQQNISKTAQKRPKTADFVPILHVFRFPAVAPSEQQNISKTAQKRPKTADFVPILHVFRFPASCPF